MNSLRSPTSQREQSVGYWPMIMVFISVPESHHATCHKVNPSTIKGLHAGRARLNNRVLNRRPASYWAATRLPFPSLLLVAPLMATYEAGVLSVKNVPAGTLRTGADAWMRHALTALGISDHWLLPLSLA